MVVEEAQLYHSVADVVHQPVDCKHSLVNLLCIAVERSLLDVIHSCTRSLILNDIPFLYAHLLEDSLLEKSIFFSEEQSMVNHKDKTTFFFG